LKDFELIVFYLLLELFFFAAFLAADREILLNDLALTILFDFLTIIHPYILKFFAFNIIIPVPLGPGTELSK